MTESNIPTPREMALALDGQTARVNAIKPLLPFVMSGSGSAADRAAMAELARVYLEADNGTPAARALHVARLIVAALTPGKIEADAWGDVVRWKGYYRGTGLSTTEAKPRDKAAAFSLVGRYRQVTVDKASWFM